MEEPLRCPTLSELPPPPPGKSGWPWTAESAQLPDTMPDGAPWPRVSIVTPSYNQAQFIEETIRSVLLQGYPDLEYIIIDGGSTDGSVEIIRKYEPWLAYWVSEKDRGQSHALNKGFRRATGEVIGWLNADDIYAPNAFYALRAFRERPGAGIIYSDCLWIDEESQLIGAHRTGVYSLERLAAGGILQTPAVFFKQSLLEKAGYLDESLHYAMDTDFWLRACPVGNPFYLETPLGFFRRQRQSKTLSQETEFGPERIKVYESVLLSEPFRSNIPQQKRRELLGNLYWRAGIVMCDNGQVQRARPYIEKAIQEYQVLAMDSAIDAVILHFSDGRLLPQNRVEAILQTLPVDSQVLSYFRKLVWTKYNTVQFFDGHNRGDLKTVRRSGVKMLLHKPAWLLNRGYRSIWLEAWIGVNLANTLRQIKLQFKRATTHNGCTS